MADRPPSFEYDWSKYGFELALKRRYYFEAFGERMPDPPPPAVEVDDSDETGDTTG